MKTILVLVILIGIAFFLIDDSQKREAEKARIEEAEKGRRAVLLEMERDKRDIARQMEENARAEAERRAAQRTPAPGAWMYQDNGNPLERGAYGPRH